MSAASTIPAGPSLHSVARAVSSLMRTFSVSTWVGFGQTCTRREKRRSSKLKLCRLSWFSNLRPSLSTHCLLYFVFFFSQFIYLFVPPHLCPFPLSALCVEEKPQFPIARFLELLFITSPWILTVQLNASSWALVVLLLFFSTSNLFQHIRWICADGSLENIRLQERRVRNAFACSNRFPSVF